MKTILASAAPESEGVSSRELLRLVRRLQGGGTEPHGLMITRHGKVVAQGWWKPFSRDCVHGMQSLTKTWAGAAIGIAIREGILGLDDRIVDLFPKEAAGVNQPLLPELRLRHVLSMSTGMRKLSGFDGDWVKNFLENPILDPPGTTFFYNSVGSTLLGEIIRRKTGDTLDAYLEKHLYHKLGMDTDRIRWMCLPDGLEIGGSGLFTTLENNTLLGQLYLNGGRWNGEQLLDPEFCRLAGTKQVDNAGPGGAVTDGHAGYGFQLWMGLSPETYCMSGAWGQYTIICPRQEMVISFTGRTDEAVQAASESLLGKFWDFLAAGVDRNLGEETDQRRLQEALDALSLGDPVCRTGKALEAFSGSYRVTDGCFSLDAASGGIMQTLFPPDPIASFSLSLSENELILQAENRRGSFVVRAGLDGSFRTNELPAGVVPCRLLLAAAHLEEDTVVFALRWVETCYSAKLRLTRTGDGLLLSVRYDDVDPWGAKDSHFASAVRMEEKT